MGRFVDAMADAPSRYPPIADYGIIGDMGAAALVATDGSIDWCCLPRFDSPALFDRLLDADGGGYFRIAPTADFEVDRAYLPGTNILQTHFSTTSGEVRMTDFMPVDADLDRGGRPDIRDATRCLIRRLECTAGRVDLQATIRPTVDWGAIAPRFSPADWGVRLGCGGRAVALVARPDFDEIGVDRLRASFHLERGEQTWISLQYLPGGHHEPVFTDASEAKRALETSAAYWRNWIAGSQYDGPSRELIDRSALVLKLLTFAPTGAVVAAPTTSLPEDPGGVRNWDYRYVWLRDAGMALRSLQDLGFHTEAMNFWDWLESLSLDDEKPLQTVYTVEGDEQLPERQLDHLEGYLGSKPVRVGNGAARQFQLDRFGHLFEAAYLCITDMREPHPDLAAVLERLADRVCRQWTDPDHGLWEIGAERRQYTHSKLACWVALDRALRLAEDDWLNGDRARWRKHRRQLRVVVEQRGFNREIGAFTQTLDGESLDASSLMIPLVGFLPASDPRVQSTVARIRRDLTGEGGLVRRYRTGDGLPGEDGAFVMCSFWLVSVLAESGQLEEARRIFEHVCSHANDLGLLAEEISPDDGRLLGNFPQGFSHLSLIEAARRLHRAGGI